MLKNYIKIAFKVMLRRKYYTFLALVGISFTIMITTMAASFIDQIVGASASEPNRNRTLMIKDAQPFEGGESRVGHFLALNEELVKKHLLTLKTPEKVSMYKDGGYVSVLNKTPRSHALKCTDENFWYITDFEFIEGKPYNRNDVVNAGKVVVLTDALKEYYFGDAAAIGKSISMYGSKFKVIGVVKPAPMMSDVFADAWIPYTADPSPPGVNSNRTQFWGPFKVMVLAHSPADFRSIRQEIRQQMKRVIPLDPKIDSVRVNALTAVEQFARLDSQGDPTPKYATVIIAMSICLILFMLIPVISLINLNISRMAERSAEIGIRKSFGASSGKLVGQFLVENIILTLTGGIIGLGLAFLVSDGLVSILNTFDPLYKMAGGQFILSWRVFAFAIGCCLFFGFLSGVYPAFRMSRLHPVNALKGENL